ncbi:hypothetical protein GV829_12575 [Sphingomonas lacunae]|uniref:Uncharacterized protein n=1 Tax=Sphingomonas lacunae TaxID=2698828 RepID=A0A6M4AVL0_9SPHN|nr:hypothetical protein [Sphingomonas lacunae]QJQ33168.1 hypothetical protein GV829_12575 [Sphingomonas lacunae]
MVHLMLSLGFTALLLVGFRSIWHDLTRPLVMQPWDDEVGIALPAPVSAARPAMTASVTQLHHAARYRADAAQALPLAA